MLGRVLRTYTLKPTAVIIDITDNWKKHGLPDEARKWSLLPKIISKIQNKGLIQCEHCTHIFKPLTDELANFDAEVDEDGVVIQHHQAICPSYGETIDFTTKENFAKPSFSRIRLRQGFLLKILLDLLLEIGVKSLKWLSHPNQQLPKKHGNCTRKLLNDIRTASWLCLLLNRKS
ncbi:hypothetical protein [Nostoc sp. UIC 10630]|uniref:hypothetical protein n=1 Tax=Nostoc sp. UIC 10630 TaxID=2100146 RepID=UPI0013D025C5|nr:hypothetical protein [Nostoc sp. UIC 10630]NEU78694.1 hypothetical protein [Nostoc sp. UIC 10630]